MKELIEHISLFDNTNERIINIVIGIVILVLLVLFKNKLSKGIVNLLGRIIFKKDETKRNSLTASLQKPFSLFFLLLGIFVCSYLNFRYPSVVKGFKICTILIICWGLINYLSENISLIFKLDGNADDKINVTAIKFISNILKIIIIAFAVVMIISELGYNISGLITGIGVGGLAVSLAAQDAVENLISGFIIVFDKPFAVGDFVQTKDIMGTVEEVTMRSTKFKTLDDTIVTIPNSAITSDAVINISKMEKRLIDLEFGLVYSSPNALLEKCQTDIKSYLLNNENILPSPIRAEITKLDDSSINIGVFCYTNKTNVHEYYALLSEINLKLKEIIEANGAEFAFPSSSIYIEKK